MVRPRHFGFNAETAPSNRFQQSGGSEHTAAQAQAEFDAFAAALAGEGVTVSVAQDSDEPRKPDAVFPNNWVSFHADGTAGAVSHAGGESPRRTAPGSDRLRGAGHRIPRFAARWI